MSYLNGNVDRIARAAAAAAQATADAAIPRLGVTDGSDAAAGMVGEYGESVVPSGSALTLTSTVTTALTSIILPAGDYDVDGTVVFDFDATTNATLLRGNPGTIGIDTSAGFSIVPGGSGAVPGAGPTGRVSGSSRAYRISSAVPVTVSLYARADFTIAGCRAYGTLRYRRGR